jgi:LysR family transcriptional regulator, carnitine catabolism transcriptional activator
MPGRSGRKSTAALFKFKPIYDTSSNDLIVVDECSTMEFTSRQLRAFLLVAQHRSFSRAAEALYVTPSGLSVLIRGLESQLGFRLFNRTTRHVGLTTHGSELLAVVQHSLEKLDTTVSRVGRMATEASMSLSVGAPPLIAANVLPDAIKEFRGHRPEIRIQVFDVGGDALTQLVETGKVDMSLGAFFKPASGIRRTPLFRFSLMVIRPDNDPNLRRTSTTWSALKDERLISLTPGQLVQQFIEKHLARIGVVLHPCAVFNYLDTQIAMVESGEGVAIIPSFVLPACRNRKVVLSRLINPVVNLDFSWISNRGKKLPPGADDFTSFLKSYIARWAGRAGIL